MNSKFAKKAASGAVSGLALGLILALTATPSLAAPHGGHEGGGYQGDRGGGRGGWNHDTSSSTSRDDVRPAAPATTAHRDSRTPATNTTANSNRPWWGGNNHAPLNGRPAQIQTQTTPQQPATHYDNARDHGPGRGPEHDNTDRSGRDDHRPSGGHDNGNNDRGDHNWNGGGDRGDHNWNDGGDRGNRYGGGDRNNHYGNRGFGDNHYNGEYNRGRTHFDWHDNQRFRGYSGVRYGFYFFPGVGYYNVPSQWYGHRWMEGEYLPDFFDSYRIYDWQSYDLPIPPYGCAWYFLGEDAVLVDLDSGRIVDVIYDFY